MDGRRLTCLLTSWRREQNVRRIVDCLRSQSVNPLIWLWSNEVSDYKGPAVDWHIRSSRNVKGNGWLTFMRMLETPYFCKLDDDCMPKDDKLLEDAVAELTQLPPNSLLGPHGVRLRRGVSYRDCQSPQTEEPSQSVDVDLIKFRLVLGRSREVRSVPFPFDTHHNDIHVSFWLAGCSRRSHRVSSLFHKRMTYLPEGEHGMSRQPGHWEQRNELCQKWLRTVGE